MAWRPLFVGVSPSPVQAVGLLPAVPRSYLARGARGRGMHPLLETQGLRSASSLQDTRGQEEGPGWEEKL